MHIQVFIDGGFVAAPGLAKPIDLDDATLSPPEQAELKQLVRAAREQAKPDSPASPAPDARNYRIQIDNEPSLAATDITLPPEYSNLIKFVRKHGSR